MEDAIAELDTALGRAPIVPVVVLEKVADSLPVAESLLRGGATVVEVTLRSDAALESITRITELCPDLIVGAGTVLTATDAERAAAAGARFLISPGFTDDVTSRAAELGIPAIPGVATASDVQRGVAAGMRRFKFFPAEANGGASALRALRGPFPDVTFVPTGGIGPDNLADYFATGNVCAVGGSWMVPIDVIARGDFTMIERLTREALATIAEACTAK